MDQKFHKYPAGTVTNPLTKKLEKPELTWREIKLKYPSRLNAMAIDPSKIAKNERMVFTPGEVVFSIKIYKTISIHVLPEKRVIEISDRSERNSLIKHSVRLMQQALGVDDGLFIDVDNRGEVKHCGLGSSGSLISGVAATVNELYGKPLCGQELVKYLAQNHGEEVEGDDKLVQQVQCIGGSAASGLVAGGLFVIAGESQVIKTMKVPKHYKVVIGIPRDFIPQDAELMMEKEEKNLEKFVKTGERYGSQIAYRMLHEVLPAMNEQVLKPIGDLIFDYRFNMGSIENCAFVYPGIVDIAKEVQDLKENGVCEVLALSSVGPGFFGITRSPEKVKKAFEASGMQVIETEIENRKYQVVRRKQC